MWKLYFLLPVAAFCQDHFEVASIKPMAATDNRIMIRMAPGGTFMANGATVKMLIGMAYDMRNFQISGGPGWIESDRFEINAKAEGEEVRPGQERFRKMLQNLLAERFGLKVHEESKEGNVYHLLPGKNGPKLVEAKEGGPEQSRIMMGRGQMIVNGATLAQVAQTLGTQLGRDVIDKTGLKGRYEINLTWTPDPSQGSMGIPLPPGAVVASDNSGPSIFTALEETLGLRLESAKGPVKQLVIDKVEKPTEN